MFGSLELLRGLAVGQALPNVGATAEGTLPVLIGAVAEALPDALPLDYTAVISCDMDGAGHGPSLRVAVSFSERAPALFGSLTVGGPVGAAVALQTGRVVGWLNPANEEHLLWVNRALEAKAFGVEIVTPEGLASADFANDQGRTCQRLWLKDGLGESLQRNFYRAMAAACELPWSTLDFEAACQAHAAQHPLGP